MSLSVTSCKSDDDNNNGGGNDNELLEGEPSDEAVQAWTWVSVLTDATEQPAGWQSQSFDATIGVQSSNDPGARLIFVSDLDGAKANFASISGCDPEELNGTKTVSAGEFGSMTWNISAPGAPNIATVDVSSPLLKKLERIIYCTEEQAPDNAEDLKYNCYYRIGDVVEDKEGYYWVCVQSSFKGKKNQDSYWVNIFNENEKTGVGKNSGETPGIPAKNIQGKWNNKAKYNNNLILLPTGLKMDRQQIYNLCNLVWALVKPDAYLEVTNNVENTLGGLPRKYHAQNFLEHVDNGWDVDDVYEKLFNCSKADISKMEALHFFYNGYHWKAGTTAGVWIYTSRGYQKKYTGKLKNDDTLFEMKAKNTGFNIHRYASGHDIEDCASTGAKGVAPAKQFTEKEGYWVIRVATGKQLDKNYNPYEKMKTVDDIFNFNESYNYPYGEPAEVPEDEKL